MYICIYIYIHTYIYSEKRRELRVEPRERRCSSGESDYSILFYFI